MSIQSSFCFNGQPFQLAYQDTIAFISGRVLYFWDLSTGKKDYIVSPKNGFQSFICHPQKGLIFVAEYSLKPSVYVYSYPSKQQLAVANEISELEIIQMDVSLDASKLLVVTGVPNYEITIFDCQDVQNIKRLEGQESAVPLKSKFVSAKFSLQKDTQFAVLYEQSLVLCEINPSFEHTEILDDIQKNVRISKTSIKAEGQFQSFIWDEQNNIYLADKFDIKYLNGNNLQEIMTHESSYQISFFILTQKHIIVIHENGLFEWLFKYDPSLLEDEEMKPFKFDKRYSYQDEKISSIMYNHNYTKIFAGTTEGSILVLPEEAESLLGEDEEEPNENEGDGSDDEERSREIEIDLKSFGPFHVGSVIYIKEIVKNNVVLTVSSLGRIFLWDIRNEELKFTQQLKANIVSACVSKDQSLLILGSTEGVLRILDISDLTNITMLKHIKLFQKNKSVDLIDINKEHNLIAVGSRKSKKVYFISCNQESTKPFRVVGYTKMPQRVNAICFNSSQVQRPENNGGPSYLFVLYNFFLISVQPPNPDENYQNLYLNEEQTLKYGRKVDANLQYMAVNPNSGDIITTGLDKLYKQYPQPTEDYSSLDHKQKPPAQNQTPAEEVEGHSLPINVLKAIEGSNQFISGAQDGTIFIREFDNLQTYSQIKGHNLKSKGVSALEYSNLNKLCYSGGHDGSFFIWRLQSDVEFADQSQFEELPERNVLEEQQIIRDVTDVEITHYQKVLEEEFIRSQKEVREKQKQEIQQNLKGIKNELDVLLANNEQAEDLEKLDRDEFVIDIETKDAILEQGGKDCSKIREDAQRDNYRLEILRKRIKEKTWDSMQTHLKAINGLDSNIIVNNYHIRDRTQDELKKLNRVKNLRKIELKEKQVRKEQQLNEVVDISDYIKNPNEYFVNGQPGKSKLVLVDYEQQEEAKQQEQLQANKQGKHGGQQGQQGQQKMGGRMMNQRNRQEEQKKKEQEEKEAEERKQKALEEEKQKQEKEKENGAELTDWHYLYGSLELFTNNRKRNQIVLLHNIIFKVKDEFNKEFDKCMNDRMSMIDNIQDKNKKIEEILIELHKDVEFFEPKINIMENPEKNILQVIGEKEIPFEKYLTREERKKQEEIRKKEEARLAALMADDAGRRAVQQMMDGTIEEKKENPLDEELEKEDWMDLPQEEMSDEQKIRFKEYEVKLQKQEEEKEKIRKNLESQLKKLRQELVEICQKFDQKLLILFRRKLEYDYRIFEQELYIVKLSQSLIQEKDYSIRKTEYENLITDLSEKQNAAQEMINQLKSMKDTKDAKKRQVQQNYDLAFKLKQQGQAHMIDENKLRQIWNKVFLDQKDAAEKKQYDERLMQDEELKDQLIPLDPLLELRKKQIKKYLESKFESYKSDILNKAQQQIFFEQKEDQGEGLNQVYKSLEGKFDLKKELEELDIELRDINTSLAQQHLEDQDVDAQLNAYKEGHLFANERLQTQKSNIEVILRFKQGFVEIQGGQMSLSLDNAVLIPREHIEKKNHEVQTQGDQKINLMEAIKNIKDDVAEDNYNLKKLEKTIERVECQTREVQLLKVKKEMQLALTKKDMKLNEYELQGLQNQINILIDTTNKRISAFQKKEEKIDEQIEFIIRENESLRIQGAQLDSTVKQRQKIYDMMYKKNQNQQQQIVASDNKGDEQAYGKFKQIACNRKLYDLAKRQTETIELLRDELNKLKARTFANFSNVTR